MIEQPKWGELPLIEQLAHVGAEIHRAGHWEQKKDKISRNKSLERAIDLMDLILNNAHLHHRTREIARLREVVCDCYTDRHENNVSLSALDNYFLTLAIYARKQKQHVPTFSNKH